MEFTFLPQDEIRTLRVFHDGIITSMKALQYTDQKEIINEFTLYLDGMSFGESKNGYLKLNDIDFGEYQLKVLVFSDILEKTNILYTFEYLRGFVWNNNVKQLLSITIPRNPYREYNINLNEDFELSVIKSTNTKNPFWVGINDFYSFNCNSRDGSYLIENLCQSEMGMSFVNHLKKYGKFTLGKGSNLTIIFRDLPTFPFEILIFDD